MKRNISHFLRLLASLPRVVCRRRARGGLTHQQFKDACLIFQICLLVHCFMAASIWWARSHKGDPTRWLGVAMAVAWVVFFWWFLLKQAYMTVENAVEREIQR
ncbi:hypothetical protein WJ32_01385 [Burkholderia ubonensis]|uniref:Uncharacterized protein n=1 Tax=Burkholderia ubonensis TaxID=101571 RepID=A0A103R618_9BURK|nr:hypothetical protein [Burkholderia ubonensis]AOJ61241.1 hypothetical protein WJ32_01385 [Burkholderia ubonensis]KVG61799.1 hypothetical protein WJ33_30905 [Burkholderia ubonensis]